MADASAGPAPLASEVEIAPLEAPAPLDQVLANQSPAALCDCAGPVVEHLDPLAGKNPFNLSPHFAGRLGGGFSFMCTLTMEGIDSWTRVFDFSLQADEDSITAGAIDLTDHLHFTVFRGKKPISVRVDNFFELGKEFTMLCTISDSGHMKVFKDGVLVGENPDGLPPLCMERPRMFVGGHFQYHNQSFRGSIRDVKVWNQEVSWPAPAASLGESAEDAKVSLTAEPRKGLDDAPDAAKLSGAEVPQTASETEAGAPAGQCGECAPLAGDEGAGRVPAA